MKRISEMYATLSKIVTEITISNIKGYTPVLYHFISCQTNSGKDSAMDMIASCLVLSEIDRLSDYCLYCEN